MKAREGDLIETFDGNIFDVKGLVHPQDKIIAFIRFTPDPKGERKSGNTRYKKVYPLHERYTLLRERFPHYLVFDPVFSEWLCEVPTKTIKKHYQPPEFLKQLRRKKCLDELENQTLALAQLLYAKARVKWNVLGVSGSLLVGLHTDKSDIDLVVYGSQNCQRVYKALKLLIDDEASGVKPYDEHSLKALFDFRSKDTVMEFEDFVRTESRKMLQGRFQEQEYFIRCVKDWKEESETYGSTQYKPLGDMKMTATIADDSQMIFTPCAYKIEDVSILKAKNLPSPSEIVSFRGRFCEQARQDERIIAQGMVEKVKRKQKGRHFRLLVGNKPSDFMIPSR